MKIEYQTELQNWLKNTRNSIPITEIESDEINNNVNYPKAYKEFLFLTGVDFRAMGFSHGMHWLNKNKVNEYCKRKIQEENINITRPFWVFAFENECMFFFYLDDGDDPLVHICEIDYYDEEPERALRKAHPSFSSFIETRIFYYEEYKR